MRLSPSSAIQLSGTVSELSSVVTVILLLDVWPVISQANQLPLISARSVLFTLWPGVRVIPILLCYWVNNADLLFVKHFSLTLQ